MSRPGEFAIREKSSIKEGDVDLGEQLFYRLFQRDHLSMSGK